jgi:serine/threonine protein kinase
MSTLSAEDRVGTVLADKYRIVRVIGRGGFGTVFEAVHTWTDRRIAVKILHPDLATDGTLVARFLQEAKAAARLKHPHVVDVLDMGRDRGDGTVYLVLELLEGEELADRLERRGRLSPAEVFETLVPVMDALALAHERGIIHRDLKPGNVFLHRDERGRVIPKLLDFGIAKTAEGKGTTKAGTVIGTPQYMAPEQAMADRAVGPPADVWSMGVMIWQALSGRLPFPGESAAQVLADLMLANAVPLRTVAPRVPAALADAVDRALLKDLDARYPHMRAFLDALLWAGRESGLPVGVDAPGGRGGVSHPALHLSVPSPDPLESTLIGTFSDPSTRAGAGPRLGPSPSTGEGGAYELAFPVDAAAAPALEPASSPASGTHPIPAATSGVRAAASPTTIPPTPMPAPPPPSSDEASAGVPSAPPGPPTGRPRAVALALVAGGLTIALLALGAYAAVARWGAEPASTVPPTVEAPVPPPAPPPPSPEATDEAPSAEGEADAPPDPTPSPEPPEPPAETAEPPVEPEPRTRRPWEEPALPPPRATPYTGPAAPAVPGVPASRILR